MRDRPGRPRLMVGTGIIVTSPDERLLILKQEHGGKVDWSYNGGALEAGESVEDCAIREAYEGLGLRVRLVRLLTVDQIRQGSRFDGLGFIFLTTPEPWPQEVKFGTEDETRFLDYRWISRAEFDALQDDPDYDFWSLPWPDDVTHTRLRQQDFA